MKKGTKVVEFKRIMEIDLLKVMRHINKKGVKAGVHLTPFRLSQLAESYLREFERYPFIGIDSVVDFEIDT